MIQRLLIPTDFSEASVVAIDSAVALLDAAANTEITLVHALEVVPLLPSTLMPETPVTPAAFALAQEEQLEAQMKLLVDERRARGWKVEGRIERGLPHEVLGRLAEELKVDLIAMGTEGRGGIGRVLLGSVADRVVRTAPCPVLTLRPS